jgi:hypothetical protein
VNNIGPQVFRIVLQKQTQNDFKFLFSSIATAKFIKEGNIERWLNCRRAHCLHKKSALLENFVQ